jgi:hypothetical protein
MVYHDADRCKDFKKVEIFPNHEDKWVDKFKQTNGFKNKNGGKLGNQN